jgi:hypothetical protein
MTTIHHNGFEIIVEEGDILLRLQEPNSGITVNYLRDDGTVMDENVLYQFAWSDNQWFVIVNYPLLMDQINNAVELYAEEHGVEAAVGIPIDNLVHCTLRDLCEAMELIHCEDCA